MSKIAMLKARFSTKNENITESAMPTFDQRMLAVSLLNGQQFDPSGVAAVIDGRQVTYGDLLKSRVENYHRPNGTVGVHYPLVWELNSAQMGTVLTYLKGCPKKGNPGGQRRRSQQQQPATPVAAADNGLSAKLDSLNETVELLAEIVLSREAQNEAAAQPATPVEGHSIEPATPVQPVQVTGPVYRPGDVIRVQLDGYTVELQITEDAKRLRKTIVG